MNKQELRDYNKIKARQYRADRKAKGVCVLCSSSDNVVGVLCEKCRTYQAEYRQKRRDT